MSIVESVEPKAGVKVVEDATCTFCGCLCDDITLKVEDGKITAPVVNFRFNESPVRLLQNTTKLGRPVRTLGLEGAPMVAPPLVATGFTFSSISDAV